jgi:peptidoglycan/xylan/chitin deacetylase (PgdA/CDA1 family)
MGRARILPLVIAALVLAATVGRGAAPTPDGRAFLAVVLHDVVDERTNLDGDGTTTSDLVAFFEYLLSNGWHAITLDQIDRAGRGETTLPEKSILITIDDAYTSAYTRIYPLLLATRMPAIVAIPGAWIVRGRGPAGQPELTWGQAREMQQSGLVEFASHGYDLHGVIVGNPQASELPAFAYRIFDPARGYEDDDAYQRRVGADLQQSIDVMTRELGRAPRAIAWPYGRYTRSAVAVAKALGFRFGLTFDPEPASASLPLAIARFSLSTGSPLPPLVERLKAGDMLPRVQRFVRLRPSSLWRPDPGETERLLGAAIERVRTLGATALVIDAVEPGPDGRLAAWFPTSALTVRADVFLRFAWQFQRRAGVLVYGRLPLAAFATAAPGDAALETICRDFGTFTSVDGLFLEDVGALGAPGDAGTGARWEVDRARNAIDHAALPLEDRRALACFTTVERELPGLQLAIVTGTPDPRGPAGAADLTLVRTSSDPREADRTIAQMLTAGWLAPHSAQRVGLWLEGDRPPAEGDLTTIARRFLREGGTALGWSQDDPVADRPRAKVVAPVVASSIFPAKF